MAILCYWNIPSSALCKKNSAAPDLLGKYSVATMYFYQLDSGRAIGAMVCLIVGKTAGIFNASLKMNHCPANTELYVL